MTPELTMLQIKALELLGQGHSISEAARQCAVHRATIHNWCRHQPAFAQALATHRSRRLDDLHDLADDAIAALRQLLADPHAPAAAKVRASLGILKAIDPTQAIEITADRTTDPAFKNEPKKPALNQPCPCGSTFKYKRCCLLRQPRAA